MKVATHCQMHRKSKLWEDENAYKDKWAKSRSVVIEMNESIPSYVSHPAFAQNGMLISETWDYIFKARNGQISSIQLLCRMIKVLKAINKRYGWVDWNT